MKNEQGSARERGRTFQAKGNRREERFLRAWYGDVSVISVRLTWTLVILGKCVQSEHYYKPAFFFFKEIGAFE